MPKSKSSVVETTTTTATTTKPATTEKKKRVVKKQVKKTKTEPVETAPVETAPVETAPVETTPVETAPVETAPVETAPVETAPVDSVVEENSETLPEEPKRNKRTVNKFKLQTDWETLFSLYKDDIASVKKTKEQKVNLQKFLTTLRNDTFRILKLNKTDRKGAKNTGGFLKPVKISDELATFINVAPEDRENINRTDITKKICAYVKEHNLQKPEDRREIIPDETLRKLFSLTDETLQNEKLTYYSIQKKVQAHIYKV